MSMDADRLSGVNYRSHAEPNIYFQRPFKSDHSNQNTSPAAQQSSEIIYFQPQFITDHSSQNTSPAAQQSSEIIYFQPQFTTDHSSQNTSPAAQQNSENESSEENSRIQWRNTVKVTDEKQVMKIKVLMIVAVSVMSVFLALAISLALFAITHNQKQLLLSDIAEEVTKHVIPLQGNLTALEIQLINVYTKQLNEHQQLNETNGEQTQTLNEYAQRIQILNDITEMTNNDLAGYTQRTRIMEANINQNRALVDQTSNKLSAVPIIKTAYIMFYGQPLGVLFRKQDPTTLDVLRYGSRLTIPDTDHAYTSDNTIAYRPHFNDVYNSSLAVLFFNLEVAFPCLRNTNTAPACSLFSLEEDGFLGGRPLMQAADNGKHFHIFNGSSNVKTFGFGFAGCSTFARSCVPTPPYFSFELSLVCLLPSSVCT